MQARVKRNDFFFFFWQNIRVACRYMRSRNLLTLVCIYVYMYIVFFTNRSTIN